MKTFRFLMATVIFAVGGLGSASGQTLTTLHSFGGTDGSLPEAGLVQGNDSNFYGTTAYGGAHGNGEVFRISSSGSLTNLYSFAGSDGAQPKAGLVQGSDGNFYGTTASGGAHYYGAVFRISSSGTLTTLYSFANDNNGGEPLAGLVQGSDSNFYGTTESGGPNGLGTVFRISSSGTLTTLYPFSGSDGANPSAGLVLGNDGNFYGTTANGGTSTNCYGSGCGTIFQMSSSGTPTTLYSFSGSDGSSPLAGLVQGGDGNFYGTTYAGGTSTNCYGSGCGTIFRISSSGTLTSLYSFSGSDGANPQAGLAADNDGNFYGTTYGLGMGPNGHGTIFQISSLGVFTNLYAFTGGNAGATLYAGLVQGSDSNFYGTTIAGGTHGQGTVFKFSYLFGCGFSLTSTNATFDSIGGSSNVTVAATATNCIWTAASSNSFVTINSGSSGSGAGDVTYSVSSNTGASPRIGTMTVAGGSYTVIQYGVGCGYLLTSTNASFADAGGSGSVNVIAPPGCDWTATNNDSFITITSGGNNSGSGTVNYSVDANTNTVVRTGTMTIAGQTFTVTQGAAPCEFSLNTTLASFGSAGGSNNVVVMANGTNCVWTAVSSSGFITITSTNAGNGTGTVTYSVASNSNTEARDGTLTIGGQTLAVAQDGFLSGPIVIDGSADPAYGSAIVTQQLGTAFGKNTNTAVDAATGSELDAAYGMISNGVLYLVLAGNLQANFNKLEVFIQTGPGGQNTLLNSNPNVDYNGLNRMGAGGNGTLGAGPGLTFDADFAPNYWISAGGGYAPYVFYVNYAALWPIGGGSNGYFLGETTATTGTLSGGSNPFGIQATIDNSNIIGVNADVNGCYTNGAPYHPEAVRTGVELAIPLGAIGNPTGSVAVCAFIISEDYSYLSNQILGPLGTNDPTYCQGNLAEPTTANFSSLPGTHYFVVPAPDCNYSISPLTAFYGSSGDIGSVAVTVQDGCSWTATSNDGWITITSGSSGSGNGSVGYSVAANSSTCVRTGTLTVAGQTFTVSQGGAPLGPITIDGSADAAYGAPIVSQQLGTTFGENTNAVVDDATGSELDAAYGIITNGVLYLVLAGNLEQNYNDLELFIQTGPGGQNTLTNINPNIDGNGLNRMGAGGNGATTGSPGLTFDADFAPNYWIGVNGGGAPYTFFANYAQLWPGGGGSNGYYLGQTTATNGALLGGTNPFCIQATINNSNTNGVASDVNGCYTNGASYHPETITTGVELGIPLGAIGNPTGSVAVCAFINASGHAFISNQILGPIAPGTNDPTYCQGNLAEPTLANFSGLPGVHYFVVGGCNYSISASSAFYGPSAGSGSIGVTTASGCSWTATSNAGWITITSGSSGSGNGSVNYSVATNSSICVRTGTLTVAGQTVTIAQSGSPLGPITIDGTADVVYGSAIVTQQLGTAFGKNTNAVVDAATGSELDGAYGIISNGVLYMVLAGNLQANYNDLEVFIQTGPGGQNTLTNINPNIDGNGLNRMGAGGNGAQGAGPGLTFDADFAPNYWIGVNGGGAPYTFFANYAQLWPGGGGSNGYYLGQTTATNGTLLGGTNPFCIQATINNSNTNGVALDVNGCYTNGAPYHPEVVRTGVELGIPLGAIGNPTGSIAVCAFINGNGHAFVSNQILGPVAPGTNGCVGNLFEPTTLNLSALPGVHYFIIGGAPSPRPTASFMAIPSRGAAPLTVSFTDTSSGSPTSWAWTFGDGNSSTSQNPANAYPDPGDYTVTLIASSAGGSSTNTTMINVYSPFAWWQQGYGLTNGANGGSASYTGDGMSNTNKFLAGFSPTNAAAYLHIISLARQGTNMNVKYLGANGDSTWSPGIASRTNVLEYSTGAANGSYNGTFEPVPSAGATNILSGGTGLGVVTNMIDAGGAINGTSRYYRVRVLLP